MEDQVHDPRNHHGVLTDYSVEQLRDEVLRHDVVAYFGKKPEEHYAWQAVAKVSPRYGIKLDPKNFDDLLWAYEYIAGGCGVEG